MFRRTLFLLLVLLIPWAMPLKAEQDLDTQVAQATRVQAGQAAPDFTCQTTDGQSFTLSASRGKVVVLYFFSTDVGTCVVEMQNLQREIVPWLAGREDVLLLGLGRGQSREELLKLASEEHLSFPLVADTDASIFDRYFSKFVPRTVVVRRDGSITPIISGYDELKGMTPLRRALEQELR